MPYPDALMPYGPGGGNYGPELVRNGDFVTNTGDWFIQSGAAITGAFGGSLMVDDQAPFHVVATQSNVVTIGKSYLMTIVIASYTSGSISLNCGQSSGTPGTRQSGVGTFSEVLVAAGSLPSIVLQVGNTGFTGYIDRVSVREVL